MTATLKTPTITSGDFGLIGRPTQMAEQLARHLDIVRDWPLFAGRSLEECIAIAKSRSAHHWANYQGWAWQGKAFTVGVKHRNAAELADVVVGVLEAELARIAPLPAAIEAQQQWPDDPTLGEERKEEDDDLHAIPLSCTPEVKAAAARCFGAMARHGLPNDDQQMRLALMECTGEFTLSRTEWTAADYDAVTQEINAGAYECKAGRTWMKVLFRKEELTA